MEILTQEKALTLFINIKKQITDQLEILYILISRFDELNIEQKLNLNKSLNRLQSTFDATNQLEAKTYPPKQEQIEFDDENESDIDDFFGQSAIGGQFQKIQSLLQTISSQRKSLNSLKNNELPVKITTQFFGALQIDQTIHFYFCQLLEQKSISLQEILNLEKLAIYIEQKDLYFIEDKYYKGQAKKCQDKYLKHGFGVYFQELERLVAVGEWNENKFVYGILIKLKKNDEAEEIKVKEMGEEQQKYFL